MFTQSRDPNNKTNPAFKLYCPYCQKQITPSQLVSRNREMMKIHEEHKLDRNLLKSLLDITFVLLPMTEQNDMILDIEVEVHHVILIITKTTPH